MRIRIPWLLDIETVSDAKDVAELAMHPSLDRELTVRGPLLNRVLLRRVLSIFHAREEPLPGFRGRDDANRSAEQKQLRDRLDGLVGNAAFDADLLAPAIDYVAGRGGATIDAAMGAICVLIARVFNDKADASPDASAALWESAQIITASVRPLSLRGFLHRLSGRTELARRQILLEVGDEPNGLHGVAITTANIAETLRLMHALRAARQDSGRASDPLTPERFWLLVRAAPETLFRHVRATFSLPTSGSVLTRDSLILLRARKAQASEPVLGYAFMTDGWSACPAANFVPALCWFIWKSARDVTP